MQTTKWVGDNSLYAMEQAQLPTNPRTAYKDVTLANLSDGLEREAIESIENATELSIRNATLTGRMVDFEDYLQV